MAIVRLTINGNGQLELNNCTFPRDGRVEAQCALSTASFSSSTGAENGMLLAVDKKNGVVKMPDGTLPVALHYSAEHMYDERKGGLKDFALYPGDFFPRLGYLTLGETFTTNTICYDSTTYTTESAFISALEGVKTTALYGTYESCGAIKVVSSEPTVGPKLEVVKKTTMPDGQTAVKFRVIG
jgi:hypothetical protein